MRPWQVASAHGNLQTTQENLRISKEFKQFIQELKLLRQITFYSIRF